MAHTHKVEEEENNINMRHRFQSQTLRRHHLIIPDPADKTKRFLLDRP